MVVSVRTGQSDHSDAGGRQARNDRAAWGDDQSTHNNDNGRNLVLCTKTHVARTPTPTSIHLNNGGMQYDSQARRVGF